MKLEADRLWLSPPRLADAPVLLSFLGDPDAMRSTCGSGFATELTRFCPRLAGEQLGLAVVRAFARPDNAASRRVLEKAGFHEERFVPDMNRFLHEHRAQSLSEGPGCGR